MTSNRFVIILVLVMVQRGLCKPATAGLDETGRGFGSTLWGWVTYPFTWWSEEWESGEEQRAATPAPRSEGVTVWCDEQTCTTRRCDVDADADAMHCANTTCGIYDTDVTGACRPEPNRAPSATPRPTAEERPLRLEAVLSSTVHGDDDTEHVSRDQQI